MPTIEIRPKEQWKTFTVNWVKPPIKRAPPELTNSKKYHSAWEQVETILGENKTAILVIESSPGYADEADCTRQGIKRIAKKLKQLGEIDYDIKTLIERDIRPSKIDVLFIERQ